MSFVVAAASPPFTATGAIQVYAYEPFSYRFLFPPGNTFRTFSNTSTNLLGYMSVDATGVTFASSNGFNSIVSSNANLLVIVDSASNVYSNSVFGGAGRFTDASGNSVTSGIVVYANEAFTPIPFYSFYVNLNPATAFTQPTLPVAMNFYGSNSNLFYLGGQTAVTTGAANYVLVASNVAGQVISANINIQVLSERLQLIGGPVTLSLTVGVPITPVTFTAIPPIASSNLTFTYPAVPSGLGFTDSSGNPVTGFPFRPSDNKIVLTGTPTIATPTFGTQSITVPLRANVTSVFTGNLSNSTTLTFNYTETVVFTTPSNNAVFSNAFVNLPITPIPFNAVSYFGGGSTIISLSSPDLRSDLSLNSISGVATLTGTPTFAGSNTFTARAVSLTGVTGSIQFTFISQNDVLTLSPFVDSSLNFIIGRPLANPLAGYYSSNLTLTARSSAAQPITFSTTGFAEGGIDISSNVTSSGTTITFSGVPTTLVAPTTATVTANDGLLSVERTIPFAVLNDVFTWSTATPTFLQNRTITPIQISATTLSGRVVISYFATGLPSGLSMSRTGLITGTCFANSGGSFVVTASTGISTQSSPSYVYTVVPDALLVSAPLPSYSLVPGQVVSSIPLTGVLSSGLAATSFILTGQTYGLTITSGGVLGGTLFSGQPPNTLVASANIAVNAVVGTSLVPTSIVLTSTLLPVLGQLWAGSNKLYAAYTYTTSFSNVFSSTPRLLGTGASLVYLGSGSSAVPTSSDVQVTTAGRYVASMSGVDSDGTAVIGSVFAGDVNTSTPPTSTFLTAVNGEQVLYRSAFSVAYSGSGSTWYALGLGSTTGVTNTNHVYLLKSTDDGETWTLGYITTSSREPRNWAFAVRSEYEVSNLFIDWSDDFFYATNSATTQNLGSVVLRRSAAAGIYMAGGAAGLDVEYSALRITSMEAPPPLGETQATLVPSWTAVTSAVGGFAIETRDFAIDVPVGTPWVAAGSTLYSAVSVKTFDANTLRWSSDNGLTWNNSTNDFTFTASAVTYGGGRWVAIGSDTGFTYYAKRSTDGLTWTTITLPSGQSPSLTSTIVYSNLTWIILVNQRTLYYNTSPTLAQSSWVFYTRPFTGDVSRASVGFSTVDPYGGNSTLTISTLDPAIQLVSPTSTSFSIMQFTNMTPITLILNQSPAFFFVAVSDLPVGMRFDPTTATFSGMLMVQGAYNVRVTAKSTAASFNTFDFTFRVYSPYPQKRQDTASAFTSYVRQEAIIAGAQFSRDVNAFPSENTTVGAAMGPFPPLVQQAPEICCLPLPSVKN
jgi:hypothetical protein